MLSGSHERTNTLVAHSGDYFGNPAYVGKHRVTPVVIDVSPDVVIVADSQDTADSMLAIIGELLAPDPWNLAR